IRLLGGGIAVQHRMAFQGEYFMHQYGEEAVRRTPPIRRMLDMGVPVGAGTDATRVASFNPFVSLYWMVSGKTVGNGRVVYADEEFKPLAPPDLPVSPSWSPVAEFGGYSRFKPTAVACVD